MIEAEQSSNRSQPVAVGTHVEVELIDEAGVNERLEFDLVPDKQADFANGFLGESTPLAQAILGQTAGSVVAYRVGDVAKVSVLTVTLEATSSGRRCRGEAASSDSASGGRVGTDQRYGFCVGRRLQVGRLRSGRVQRISAASV